MKMHILKKQIIFIIVFLTVILNLSLSKALALQLKVDPWKINADGIWVTTIYVTDRHDFVSLHSNTGEVAVLPLWAFHHSAIRILLRHPQEVIVTAKTLRHPIQLKRLILRSPKQIYFNQLRSYALAVGPYLVNIGWGWLGDTQVKNYQLYRKTLYSPEIKSTKTLIHRWDNSLKKEEVSLWDKLKNFFFPSQKPKDSYQVITQKPNYNYVLMANLGPGIKHYYDTSAQPNSQYNYRLVVTLNDGSQKQVLLNDIKTPMAITGTGLWALKGKGIILLFNTVPHSPFYYKKLNPNRIISEVRKLGLHYIELRTVYGAFSHFNDEALIRWLDQFLDLAAANHIAMISWSIPRRETSNAISEDAALAIHMSPKGNRFSGIALDLELGAGYMQANPQAKSHISNYAFLLRKAMGNHYLLAAMVYSPWKTGYTNKTYPYKELAQHVDVLQPMEFWHFYYASHHHYYSKKEVSHAIKQAIFLTQKFAQKDIPVNVIGQLTDLGGTGKPSGRELIDAFQAAKDMNALGLSLFDWHDKLFLSNEVLSSQAKAIQSFPW